MAEKSAGKGISKKLGPLPYWGWGLAAVGGYLGYRYLKAREAADAATVASGTTGGTTIPTGTVQTSGSTTGLAGTFTSLAAWEQAALTYLTGNGVDPGDALNGVSSWLNGNCVSQTIYNQLSGALTSSSVGLPPGFSTVPTLSVCPSTSQNPTSGGSTPPSTPSPSAPSGGGTITQTLAQIDAAAWPAVVKYGQDANAATDFTAIGTVTNGVFSGTNVTHGAPVYAGVDGGYAQDFNESTLPNGTILYAPTTLVQQGYLGSHT